MKFKKAIPYGIKIEPTINGGFIVYVGCSVTLAYSDLKQLRKACDEYLGDPDKVHEEYKKAAPGPMTDQVHVGTPPSTAGLQAGLPAGALSGRR